MRAWFLCAVIGLALLGCTASAEDCDALGEHFLALSIAEAETQGVSSESIAKVAETLAVELVAQCKAEPRRKSELDCLNRATNFAELAACSQG